MVEVVRARIEGVAELKAALDELGVVVATKVGVAADRKAAQAFRDVLVSVAPYDPRFKLHRGKDLGHLRTEIKVRKARAERQGHIIYNVTVGRAFWGFFVEFGTSKMAAQPFMRPAFEASRELMMGRQIDELMHGIEAAAKRAARIRRV